MVSEVRRQGAVLAPTALRAIRREDPTGSHISSYDLSTLTYLFQAGERLDPDTYAWASGSSEYR